MGKSNKQAKKKLIEKYGEVCFIEELQIRTPEEIEKERKYRYKGKKQLAICDQLTYHHILEKCKGGTATEENGALLRYINHQWFHRLSPEQQKEINKMFQEYKRTHSKECKVEMVESLDLGFEVNTFVFMPEEIPKRKYDRAKDKRKFEKQLKEWEEER